MKEILFGLTYIDLLGYLAMVILLISFIMKDVRTLRIVNSFGCLTFAIWGTLIDEWPVVITNVSILCINLYYLFFKLKKP